MIRYYNENPQVILWRELAQKSQEAAMESQEIAWKAVEEVDEWKSMVKEAIDNASEANELSNKLNDTVDGYRMLIKEFNSLPWYRKIFYKFNV